MKRNTIQCKKCGEQDFEVNVNYCIPRAIQLECKYCGYITPIAFLGIEVVRVAETDTKDKCKGCTYYGRPADAPESVPLDCMYQPEEGEEYKPPCEESEV